MRISHLTTMVALMALFAIGCSKHRSQRSHVPPPPIDLSAYEPVEEPASDLAVTNAGANTTDTNDLVAVALKTHTKEAWLNALYKEIEADPDIDKEMNADPAAGIRAIKAMNLTNAPGGAASRSSQ